MNAKIAEIVTSKIIAELEKGNCIWLKSWKNNPISHQTKKPYTGINHWILNLQSMEKEYKDNLWLTYKQATRLKGNVKKGEHGTPIIFFQMVEYKDKDNAEKIKSIPLLRYFNVFNISQTENITVPDWFDNKENNQIMEAESIYNNMQNKPELKHGGEKSAYYPTDDYIQIPDITKFKNSNAYYATLYHEMIHATGNEKRLNRNIKNIFGDQEYSKEELTAEMGSSILNHHAGINTEELLKNNAGYIQSWLKILKDDKSLIIKASSQAEKAVKYILNENQEQEKQPD